MPAIYLPAERQVQCPIKSLDLQAQLRKSRRARRQDPFNHMAERRLLTQQRNKGLILDQEDLHRVPAGKTVIFRSNLAPPTLFSALRRNREQLLPSFLAGIMTYGKIKGLRSSSSSTQIRQVISHLLPLLHRLHLIALRTMPHRLARHLRRHLQ